MNVLTSTTHRTRLRALVGITVVALTAGAALAPSATAATTTTAASIYGTSSPTYDGVYRQSLAILGLHAAGVTPDPSAVQWLLEQQCANKGFASINTDPTQACPAFDNITYSGGIDTNATAVAAQALIAAGRTTEGVAAATYLKGIQNPDGGWEYTANAGSGSDPNSTALVLTALDAAAITPTLSPVDYFADLQNGQGLDSAVPEDDGGIASPYSNGAPDTLATVQSIPGVGGANLVDVPAPSTWAATPTAYPTAPAVTAGNVAGWASTWLAAQVDDDAVTPSNLAWAILSFATTATAKNQADDAYASLRGASLDISSNPAALGQAALAAKALGKTADATRYANLIAKTLTTTPTASYSLSSTSITSTQSVTLTRTALTGTPANVKQTVSWGDGTSTTGLASVASTWTHAYTTVSAVVRDVTVTLSDNVANSRIVAVGSVAVGPVPTPTPTPTVTVTAPAAPTAPAGSYALSSAAIWSTQSVTLNRTALIGTPANVTQTISWGDGTTTTALASVASKWTHTYTSTGVVVRPVAVTLTDKTLTKSALVAVGSVKVTKDTVDPKVAVTTPSSPSKVSSWTTITGTSSDVGLGVKSVTTFLVEKRGTSWYAYDGSTWVKKSSSAKATSAAKRITVTPNANGVWTLKVAKLKKGSLTLSVSAKDKAGNTSATKSKSVTLTK